MLEGVYAKDTYEAAKKMMDVAALRHRAYASNLANIETPGYKRVDFSNDFEARLQSAVKAKDVEKLKNLKPQLVRDTKTPQVRADGNNVELDRELLNIKQNALLHEFSSKVLSDSIKKLKLAARGKQ